MILTFVVLAFVIKNKRISRVQSQKKKVLTQNKTRIFHEVLFILSSSV